MNHMRGMQSFLPSGTPGGSKSGLGSGSAGGPDEPEVKDNPLEERVELRGIPSGKRKRPGAGARKSISKPSNPFARSFPPASPGTGAGRDMPMKTASKRMPPMPPKRY